ncbi:uncharacterized protein PAC_06372 [Phialocephala subalpina]|uniref:Uncharacterized protein n=1 Tax=Phialocephala subalpina TaxID=576137 RepID=A0A1L7WUM6_9HELO|nr:uncharacterized protein PAC_06372 [Phialocephala subalpina]
MASIEKPTYATFRYLSRGSKVEPSPHLYHLPPLASFGDVQSLPIIDIKSSMSLPDTPDSKSPFSLNKHGFRAVRSPSAVFSPPYIHSSWNDPTVLREVYIKEIEEMLLKVTGGRKVYTDQVVIRNNLHTEVDGLARSQDKSDENAEGEDESEIDDFPKLIGVGKGTGASPAPKVHLDLAPEGARTHLRKYHPKATELAQEIISAEDAILKSKGIELSEIGKNGNYTGPRWAMFSVWRPLKKVLRDPLAVGDCSTFPKGDYVDFDVLFPTIGGGEGETHREKAGEGGEGEL